MKLMCNLPLLSLAALTIDMKIIQAGSCKKVEIDSNADELGLFVFTLKHTSNCASAEEKKRLRTGLIHSFAVVRKTLGAASFIGKRRKSISLINHRPRSCT